MNIHALNKRFRTGDANDSDNEIENLDEYDVKESYTDEHILRKIGVLNPIKDMESQIETIVKKYVMATNTIKNIRPIKRIEYFEKK